MAPLENDNFLLSCLFSSGGINSIDWNKVALLNGYSHPGTGRNRFAKLRRAYEESLEQSGGIPKSAPPTPSGRKRGRKPKGYKEEEGEGDGGQSPKKRGKMIKAEERIKSEVTDGSE